MPEKRPLTAANRNDPMTPQIEFPAPGWTAIQFEAFDTINRITLPADCREALLPCWERCLHYHRLFAPNEPKSDLFRLRQGAGTVRVHSETCDLMRLALDMGRRTGGLFDVTVGGAVSLWNFKHRKSGLPSQHQLSLAVQCHPEQITVGHNAISLPHSVMPDFGGIAKGYIADRLTELLRDRGVNRGMVDLGGNISLLGERATGLPWRVGLQQPHGDRTELFAIFSGSSCSVVTSSASERYVEHGGVRYHHLLDPKTGRPVPEALRSVTVIAPCSATADALATACFVGGPERAKALLAQFAADSVEGVLLEADGSVYLTPGLSSSGQLALWSKNGPERAS